MTFACMVFICTSFSIILVILLSATQPHHIFSQSASHLPSSASTTTGSAATNQLPHQTLVIPRAARLTGDSPAPFFYICTPRSSNASKHTSICQLHVSRSILTFLRVCFKHVLTHLSPSSFTEDSRSWLTIHPSIHPSIHPLSQLLIFVIVPLTQSLRHRQISASKVVHGVKK
jgi:hypothetical protein